MRKRLLSLVLAGTMALSLSACGEKATAPASSQAPAASSAPASSETVEEAKWEYNDFRGLDYETMSSQIYLNVLSDFYDAHQTAMAEKVDVSLHFALEAIAEAKLIESGVFSPIYSDGGMYALGRVAPRTGDRALWGNDMYRYHNRIVTNEMIAVEDYNAMLAKWYELQGTGTYEQFVKDYLAEHGYTLKGAYAYGYTSDPKTWDCMATSRAADTRPILNTFDGLVEYDMEGTLQPALAESWKVSADGLTYTFKLRQGAVWTDSQGRKVGDVTADDFVAGLQHVLDAQGGLESLLFGVVANADAYVYGEVNFDSVGVEATDDYTLVYTLAEPCPWFITMFGYSIFAPLNRAYYASQGGKFGADFDPAAASYTYGKTPDNIAYCGPYLVTNATEKNTIVFEANPSYWNAANINNTKITWLFNDGSDTTKGYNDVIAGVTDNVNLNSSTVTIAKGDGNFEKFAYVTDTGTTSYMCFYNVARKQFFNANDNTKVVSAQTEEDATRTNAAMSNVHFRRALAYAFDRAAYNAQSAGEDLKLVSLRNSYTPADFVVLSDDVTVNINGTATKFAAGTYYGEIMQAQLDADGIAYKVWDATTKSGDGYDGWYNPALAAAEMDIVVKELGEAGFEVSKDKPIIIDLPYNAASETYTNQDNAYKQSIETATNGLVQVNLVTCEDASQWYDAGYYCDYGYESNFDMYNLSGWGPDYGDPSTYLDTFLPDYDGYMIKNIGIF